MTVDTVYTRVEAANTAVRRELVDQSRTGHAVTASLDTTERLNLATHLLQDIAVDLDQVFSAPQQPAGTAAELVRSARDAGLATPQDVHPDWWRVVAALNAADQVVPRAQP